MFNNIHVVLLQTIIQTIQNYIGLLNIINFKTTK